MSDSTSLPTHHATDQELRSANLDYRIEGFEELEQRLRSLMDMLASVLPEESGLADSIPWRGHDIKDHSKDTETAATVAQLQAVCFEILNMVEERTSLHIRQRRRNELGLDAEQGMWARVFTELKQQGFTEDEVLAALPNIAVTPVLTAHPTEAKRATVRERHLAIYRDLVRWDRHRGEPEALADVMQSIQVGLETLWHTGEIHASRPSLIGELRHIIYYLREVYPTVIRRLDVSLETAWEAAGWDVSRLRKESAYPELSFGTWVGGDRDGHPLVTSEITKDALMRLRKHCLRMHARELRTAATVLTLSPESGMVADSLTKRIEVLRQELGSTGDYMVSENEQEPWRCLCYLMREKLSQPDGYLRIEQYQADLELLESTLIAYGAETTARGAIQPLKRLAQVFGFHLATLDIRQNSPFHDAAAAQMLEIAGVEDAESFPNWPEQKRVDYLLAELSNERPFRPWHGEAGSESEKVMQCLGVLREHTHRYGSACLGPYIISMTRQVSDMLLVHLFAREAGMADWKNGTWVSKLAVCPLFETGDDLDRAGEVVTSYLNLPGGGYYLRTVPGGAHCMPVMVGYSDSNKDAGLMSGQWSLQKAQDQIARACQDAGVTPEFFHGRGGTISRGAGPVQWFLRSLPAGSLGGAMRVTEQGEVIPRKYAHHANAAYNLELLLAGVTGVTVSNKKNASRGLGDAHYQEIMAWLSDESRATYRGLLEEPGFIEFYRQATPIDALEHGCFGSRPSRRTGTSSLADLRAIPWVFSWTQARFYMPGWYGVGSALEKLSQEKPDDFKALSSFIKTEPFLRYLLTNVETNLVSADLELMTSYSGLVKDEALRDRFQGLIVPEFKRTGEMIDTIFGSGFAERRPRMLRTLEMRERPLRLLHQQQVELLGDWREAQANDDTARQDQLLNALQYSVNAIASGLRTTG
ncbi:MAG: phosphoenolpyruvate carboxylase [Akkermansiaceae bacterium]